RSLDCISVFANDAADAGLVDEVVAGFDAADPYSRRDLALAAQSPAETFRFGVPRADQLRFLGDQAAEGFYRVAATRLAQAGGLPVEVDIQPLLDADQLLYAGPWVAERAAAIEPLLRSNPAAVHPVVRSIVQGGFGAS